MHTCYLVNNADIIEIVMKNSASWLREQFKKELEMVVMSAFKKSRLRCHREDLFNCHYLGSFFSLAFILAIKSQRIDSVFESSDER